MCSEHQITLSVGLLADLVLWVPFVLFFWGDRILLVSQVGLKSWPPLIVLVPASLLPAPVPEGRDYGHVLPRSWKRSLNSVCRVTPHSLSQSHVIQ